MHAVVSRGLLVPVIRSCPIWIWLVNYIYIYMCQIIRHSGLSRLRWRRAGKQAMRLVSRLGFIVSENGRFPKDALVSWEILLGERYKGLAPPRRAET